MLHQATCPKDYKTSIGQMIDNSGDRAARNAAMAHPTGSQFNSGFDCSGILGGKLGSLLPMGYAQGSITVELTLAPMRECFVYTAVAGQTPCYEIDSIAYNAHCLSFADEYNEKFSAQLRTRGIDLSFDTYKTHVHTLPTANSVDLAISQNAASVKGSYHVLRSKDKYQSPMHDSLTTYKSGNLSEIQWDLGGRLTPEMPMKLANDGVTSVYTHNLNSFNQFRNLALGSGTDDTNFWSTESARPQGNIAGSYTALPVRRVYGTWVANGRGVYDKKDQMNPAAIDGAYVANSGEFIQMSFANGEVYNGVTLVGAHSVECTEWVHTLHFVPHDARDIDLVEPGMRCKIGTAAFPLSETTLIANNDLQSASATSNQFMNLTGNPVNAADPAQGGIVVPNANDMTGGARQTTAVGLDRFFKSGPMNPYVNTSTVAGAEANAGPVNNVKNNQWEYDGKNVMYPGRPCAVAWGHHGVAGTFNANAVTKTGIKERFVGGIGIPFVDGQNRPILSRREAEAFEGWVDCIPSDEGFYVGCSFETHQEEPGLVSGSDLTNQTPLHLRMSYQGQGGGTGHGTTTFFEGKDTSDVLTSFIHIDSVLRLQSDGTMISSV